MQLEDTYALTPSGERQIRNAHTTISEREIDLLVRIDGQLSAAQIKATLPPSASTTFEADFEHLIRCGLIHVVRYDALADGFNFAQRGFLLEQASSELEAAESAMARSGYFVRIARRRDAGLLTHHARHRVLVVDDEPQLAGFVQHYLAYEGFDVKTAADRAAVLAALRHPPPPDLVLLDVSLPDLDGFQVLASMRNHEVYKSVPVILLTAKATRQDVLHGLSLGADGYVTKPFEIETLLDAVRTVLGLPAATAGENWSATHRR